MATWTLDTRHDGTFGLCFQGKPHPHPHAAQGKMIQLPLGTSLHNPFTLTHPVPVVSIERMHEEFTYNE
jgi:hypothetical protein